MAIHEFSIFGISLSTIANLLVALGTILLAIYTCKSVKTSERQLKILQRDQEKPQARDLIRGILYDVNIDLTQEIKAITNSDIIWIKPDYSPNSPIYPLIFPVTPQKDFYVNFRQNFFGKTVLADKRIPILIESIEQKIRDEFLKATFFNSNVYDKSYWNHFFTDVNAEQLTFKQIGIDEVSRHFFRSEDVLTLDIKNAFGNRADKMLKTLKSLGIIKSVDSSTYEVIEEKQDSIGRITKGLPSSKQVFVEKYGKALLGVTVDLTPEQRAIVEELYSVLEKIKARDLSSVWAGYLGKMPNGFGNLLKPKTTSQLHGERRMLLYEAVKKGTFAWAPIAVPLPIILKQFLVVNPASAITLVPLGVAVLFNNLERSIDNKILQLRAHGLSENDPLIKQQKLFKVGARAMQILSIVATIYASIQSGAWVLALALPLFYFTYAYLQQTLISIKQHVEKGFMGIPEIQDEFAAALKANPLALEDGFIEDGAKEDKQGKGRFLIREGLTK
ncbi:MAG: hypothetical protein WCH76_03655 [Candidatus Riflemargulisbacteria bacterium]